MNSVSLGPVKLPQFSDSRLAFDRQAFELEAHRVAQTLTEGSLSRGVWGAVGKDSGADGVRDGAFQPAVLHAVSWEAERVPELSPSLRAAFSLVPTLPFPAGGRPYSPFPIAPSPPHPRACYLLSKVIRQ